MEYKIRTMAELISEGIEPEVLFWVGCAGSFDARAQKVSKAFAKILQKAGVVFAILGSEESCCGDPARRAGNEFVFQMLAQQNIQILNGYNIKKIVTICPHGYNTLKNEYPELGGNYEVFHHTQFIDKLLKEGRIKIDDAEFKNTVEATYHDSCYLGRVNNEYSAPRNIMDNCGIKLTEMAKNKQAAMCCGAGGAQMFKEEEKGDDRINNIRTKEALQTNSKTIIANCPFCITMLEDGVKNFQKEDDVKVKDIAEIIAEKI
jgi:heterodisulfide reductase subunit D